MSRKISNSVAQKLGFESLIESLSEKLSGSELNSLLLDVFSGRTKRVTPAELLKQYSANRFVQPAETDYIALLEKSIHVLKIYLRHGFKPLHLSPLSQLGTCSVIASVDQNKVISAIRNCEVLSDATNALALYISHLKKNEGLSVPGNEHIKFAAVQRHVRAQPIHVKGFAPHFTIGCMVSAGMDTGSYEFEKKALKEHFIALQDVLQSGFKIESLYFKLQKRNGYAAADDFLIKVQEHLIKNTGLEVRIDAAPGENNYYKGIQFKTIIKIKDREFEIADGGFVDWTQKLLNNKKERFCISGFGLELLNKFEEGLI